VIFAKRRSRREAEMVLRRAVDDVLVHGGPGRVRVHLASWGGTMPDSLNAEIVNGEIVYTPYPVFPVDQEERWCVVDRVTVITPAGTTQIMVDELHTGEPLKLDRPTARMTTHRETITYL